MTVALWDYLRDSRRGEKLRDHTPGPDWWSGFLKHNPELVEQKPEHLSKNRAVAANPGVKKKLSVLCIYLDHQHLVHQTGGTDSRAQH